MTHRSAVPMILAGVFASAALGQGCIRISANDSRYVETEESSFPTASSPELHIDIHDGPIEIDSWDRPEIRIVVTKRGVDRDAVRALVVSSEQHDNKVVVRARAEDRDFRPFGFNDEGSVRITATVPRETVIQAQSGDGRIDVRNIAGHVVAETGDGSIHLDDVQAVDARTGDGRISIAGRLTDVRARSGDGSLLIRAESGSQVARDWNISSGDGSVILNLPPDLGATLDAHTDDGRVMVHDLTFEGASARESRSTLRGRLQDGGALIRVRTGDGSITFRGQ